LEGIDFLMGRLIVIEGLDGSGKATQSLRLCDALNQMGKEALKISFPNYNDPSSTLVKMYLAGEFGENAGDVNAYAASTFYAVDRYASFKKYWQKDYQTDIIIIADRYVTSNAIHQLSKLHTDEWDNYLNWLLDFEYNKLELPKPDLVIYLDVPIECSKELISFRYEGDLSKKDIHERDIAYLEKCYKAAIYSCNLFSWQRIDCMEEGKLKSIEQIGQEVFDIVLGR
jgi:dTMP kinase